MTLFWKSAAALGLAIASIGATAAPAEAQSWRGRDGWRGDHGSRWDHGRRWDNRREWRGHRGYRGGYRQRCWTEWRYSHYRDRRVRVRICR